jgi:viologen exporter family transport system permease protein
VADRPTRARAYRLLLRSRIAAQTAYRRSFALDLLGQAAIILLELVEVLAVFHQVRSLTGFSFSDVLVIFGLGACAFSTADLLVGQIDRVGQLVRDGTLDILLVRPLSVLGQLVTSDLQVRRLGRLAVSAGLLAIALHRARVDWTPARAAMVALAVSCGAVIFSAIWVGASAVTFWLVEGTEFVNALTYGGNYLAQWPFSLFHLALARFFTFVVPTGFIAYLPAVAILGRPEPTGLPSWLAWCLPAVAGWTVFVAARAWRVGLRHYVGAGG